MKKILIVEDELAYLRLLHDQLHESGYTVIEANNGEKGLELAKSEHPDLILLDVRMPVMDGMEMLTELRKDAYGKKVNVIVLTNIEPNDTMIRQTIKGQPSYYLFKSDIKLDELLTKVSEVFSSGKP